jgi:hypothetical protein
VIFAGQVFLSVIILVIGYSFSCSEPSLVCLFFVLLGKNQKFHAVIIQRIRFVQVDHIKFDCPVFSCISNLEKEPLSMTVCVNVVLKDQRIVCL